MNEPSAKAVGEAMRRERRTLTVLGVALAILGIVALTLPLMTGLAITVAVGILIVAAGVSRMLFALKASSWGEGIVESLLALLGLVCGGYLMARPALGLGVLTWVLAAYLTFDGLLEIILAWRIRPVEGWGWFFASGALSLLLGILLWVQFPFSGTWAVGILVGVKLLVSGFSLVGLGGVEGRQVAKFASH